MSGGFICCDDIVNSPWGKQWLPGSLEALIEGRPGTLWYHITNLECFNLNVFPWPPSSNETSFSYRILYVKTVKTSRHLWKIEKYIEKHINTKIIVKSFKSLWRLSLRSDGASTVRPGQSCLCLDCSNQSQHSRVVTWRHSSQ